MSLHQNASINAFIYKLKVSLTIVYYVIGRRLGIPQINLRDSVQVMFVKPFKY